VETVDSQSTVLARGDSFEVLRVPIAIKWAKPGRPMAPWLRSSVVIGQVLGFDRRGLVTSSQPFTFCPGSINSSPGPPGQAC
jgi:hypothetical protein